MLIIFEEKSIHITGIEPELVGAARFFSFVVFSLDMVKTKLLDDSETSAALII